MSPQHLCFVSGSSVATFPVTSEKMMKVLSGEGGCAESRAAAAATWRVGLRLPG